MDTITQEQFQAFAGVEGWRFAADAVRAQFRTGDFATGARLFTAIADLAEAANHHPDVEVTYPSVRVTLTSHDAGGVTGKDAALAAAISQAAGDLGIEMEDAAGR
ncbi:4a-hydroxytetrahydrobiopterin dehydratase [Microbacterium protaetiae]|uniref:Putative pterin-4-alpha-carbinolamine dehydratase n=1 Tax=Microbacterium protaetiae TaxID=2509458 RepID=A0A4P6EE07_9MICO|nr:4a-hydroxytetrahydrobiopterin dehydratase [Microbacterium protaetiae]QAY60530.1 4a-hydroxytetrahydrobiopterin dehydratase [Microbacterium protaetiae]